MRRTNHRGSPWYLIGIIALIAVFAAVIVYAALNHTDRAQACRDRGGIVETDREYEVKRVTENGKTVKKRVPYTEYECKVNGKEVDEWR